MPAPDALRKARWHFVASYAHKLVIAGAAVAAFAAIGSLGERSTSHANEKKYTWRMSAPFVTEIVNEANAIVLAAESASNQVAEKSASTATTTEIATNAPLADAADVIEAVATGLARKRTAIPFESRAALIAALQSRVDASLWGLGAKRIEDRRYGRRGQKATPEALEKIIREEQAWVNIRISAAHAVIEAAVRQRPNAVVPAAPWEAILEPTSPLYVVFQLLWYALLLVGVLSVSYLVLILFAAVPVTAAESYWTKKITEILGGLSPGTAASMIKPLLASAVVAGAVLAPTMYATVPGGVSRDTVVIHDRASDDPMPPVHPGDTYHIDNRNQNFGGVTTSLSVSEFVEQTNELQTNILQAFSTRPGPEVVVNLATIESRLDTLTSVVNHLSTQHADLASAIGDVRRDTQELLPLAENSRQNMGRLLNAQSLLDTQIRFTTQFVREESARHRAEVGDMHLQLTEADGRAVLARTFGRTLFHVGPVVAEGMAKRIAGTRHERAIPAIRAMVGLDPAEKTEFEKTLRSQLTPYLTDPEIETFLDHELGRLLRLTALRRY